MKKILTWTTKMLGRHTSSLFVALVSLFFLSNSLLSAESSFFTKKAEGVVFPQGFIKGTASSTYQNGGHKYWDSLGYKPESNWTMFENRSDFRFIINRDREGGQSFTFKKSPPIDRGEKVGISADGWNRMFDDIALIKQLGCNGHRFEMPWTDLNPELDLFNEEAFSFFDAYIDALRENGIEPIITLYHWVHPAWFEKLGAWEHEKNIVHFVRYCKEVFRRFGHKVKYWTTINEPTVISACGYILGTHAPGKKDFASMLRGMLPTVVLAPLPHNYHLAAQVLANLFKAHIEVYEALKQMPHGKKAQIGIIHQKIKFYPKIKNQFGMANINRISRVIAEQFNKHFAHKTFMDFFETGHFVYDIPGKQAFEFVDKRAPHSLDFIGLNMYADVYLGPAPETKDDTEVMTDMINWAIRPEDMYNTICEMGAALKVPVLITENGISDAKDDRRERWIIGYTNAVEKAINDGCKIIGYCYWSLLDNYEWNMGHSKKFGLYEVDTLSDDPTKKNRILRKGSHVYRDYVKVNK